MPAARAGLLVLGFVLLLSWPDSARLDGRKHIARAATASTDISRIAFSRGGDVYSIGDAVATTMASLTFSVPTKLPDGVVGTPYHYDFCSPAPASAGDSCPPGGQGPINPSGGQPPYSQFRLFVLEGTMPSGLTLNPLNGILSGTPTGTTYGDGFQYNVCIIDAVGAQACGSTTLVINPKTSNLPAPTGLVATDGTYPDKVVLSWNAVPGAQQYWFYRSKTSNSVGWEYVAYISGQYTSTYDDSMQIGVMYWYRVKAVDSSGLKTGFSNSDPGYAGTLVPLTPTPTPTPTPAAPPAAPTLVSPSNGTTLDTFGPTLSWTNPAGTTQVHLQVIPFNNDGPGADVYRGSPVASFRLPPPPEWYGLLPDMTYIWKVRVSKASTYAGASDLSWSPWAEATFRTPAVSGKTISTVFPPIGSTVQTFTPTLQWANSDPNVWYYQIQISKDPSFGSGGFLYSELVHSGVTYPPNSYTVSDGYPLEPDTTYYWRVRPRLQGDARQSKIGIGDARQQFWSAVWSFRAPFERQPSPVLYVVPANPLPQGTVGKPYSFSFCVPAVAVASDLCPPAGQAPFNPTGGNPPYHFQKDPGSQFWPLGLILHPNGLLDGTPSIEDDKTFTICAVDMSGNQKCVPTSLIVQSGDDISGYWEGSFSWDAIGFCPAGSGRWTATLQLEDTVLTIEWWDSFHNESQRITTTLSGDRKAEFTVGTGEFAVSVAGQFMAGNPTTVAGTVTGVAVCDGQGSRPTGPFSGTRMRA